MFLMGSGCVGSRLSTPIMGSRIQAQHIRGGKQAVESRSASRSSLPRPFPCRAENAVSLKSVQQHTPAPASLYRAASSPGPHCNAPLPCPAAAHTPDNSFMGFVSEELNGTEKQAVKGGKAGNMAVVYGKEASIWKVSAHGSHSYPSPNQGQEKYPGATW